jgi:Domain of unknown function (DUF5076)
MAFVSNHPIYDALPISNDVLDKGGVELLRAAIVDEELVVTARREAFSGAPGFWGFVLADVVRKLASHYAAQGKLTQAEATAAVLDSFEQSFSRLGASVAHWSSRPAREGKEGAKPAKSNRSRAKPQARSRAKPKTSSKAIARRKGGRAKR